MLRNTCFIISMAAAVSMASELDLSKTAKDVAEYLGEYKKIGENNTVELNKVRQDFTETVQDILLRAEYDVQMNFAKYL